MKLTSCKSIKAAFWNENENMRTMRKRGGHNAQCCDVRQAFCDWLEAANRDWRVSDKLAARATLD